MAGPHLATAPGAAGLAASRHASRPKTRGSAGVGPGFRIAGGESRLCRRRRPSLLESREARGDMKKNGEAEDGMGRGVGKKKNPAAQRWVRWSSRVPAVRTAGRSARGPIRTPLRGGEIQAAVGGVENSTSYPRRPRSRQYPPLCRSCFLGTLSPTVGLCPASGSPPRGRARKS